MGGEDEIHPYGLGVKIELGWSKVRSEGNFEKESSRHPSPPQKPRQDNQEWRHTNSYWINRGSIFTIFDDEKNQKKIYGFLLVGLIGITFELDNDKKVIFWSQINTIECNCTITHLCRL